MISSSSSSSNLLAPGFRFHPTDEELVSYYLKRKVSNLPLRVDAIAEIDLYKWEPSELPALSRLRSRDMEWYFFSPLDRKYSNRSRTNRATASGYWKTTGKDRPVNHRAEVVGMKKTLVFHEGRAPRGQRTNWVMHEYRLESNDSSQGSFVVCRIFQKNGAGPQNGAQYGAPFIEEEWEEAEDAKNEGGARNVVMCHSEEQDFVPSEEEKKELVGDPQENTAFLMAAPEGQNYRRPTDYQTARLVGKSEEQDGQSNADNQTVLVVMDAEGHVGGNHADDMTILLEDIFDLDRYISVPGLQDGQNVSNNMGEDSDIAEQFYSHSDQNDGYMELKDIFDNANGPCAGNTFDGLLRVQNDHVTPIGANEGNTLPEVDGSEFLDIKNVTANAEEVAQACPLADDVFNLQPDDFLNPVADYSSCSLTEDDLVFYDAPDNNDPSPTGDIFTDMNDIQFSPAADLSGFDVVDDLMAYFDATDSNLLNDIFDSSEKLEYVNPATMTQPDFVSEVEGSSHPTYKANLPAPGTGTERIASSAKSTDMQGNEGWNTALRKHVVDMLGSISAPPAKAECSDKGKAVGIFSATQSSSSIHVSAGTIQVHDLTMMGHAGSWTLHKNGEMSFLLSYGMAADDVVGKSLCFEPAIEMQSGRVPMLLRGGFYLFGLSVLFLSMCLKIGMCIYSK